MHHIRTSFAEASHQHNGWTACLRETLEAPLNLAARADVLQRLGMPGTQHAEAAMRRSVHFLGNGCRPAHTPEPDACRKKRGAGREMDCLRSSHRRVLATHVCDRKRRRERTRKIKNHLAAAHARPHGARAREKKRMPRMGEQRGCGQIYAGMRNTVKRFLLPSRSLDVLEKMIQNLIETKLHRGWMTGSSEAYRAMREERHPWRIRKPRGDQKRLEPP